MSTNECCGQCGPQEEWPRVKTALQRRVMDLHEKAFMPFRQAEEQALSEEGVTDDILNDLLADANHKALQDQYLLDADDMRQIARHLLVWSPIAAPAQAEPVAPWGWAIVDKNGDFAFARSRLNRFFGAVNHEREPFTREDLECRDRESPGLAPHRIVTLYTAPAAQPQPQPQPVNAQMREALQALRDIGALEPDLIGSGPEVAGAQRLALDALAAADAQAPQPLTDEQIDFEMPADYFRFGLDTAFERGVRFAERAHGIGATGEGDGQ